MLYKCWTNHKIVKWMRPSKQRHEILWASNNLYNFCQSSMLWRPLIVVCQHPCSITSTDDLIWSVWLSTESVPSINPTAFLHIALSLVFCLSLSLLLSLVLPVFSNAYVCFHTWEVLNINLKDHYINLKGHYNCVCMFFNKTPPVN